MTPAEQRQAEARARLDAAAAALDAATEAADAADDAWAAAPTAEHARRALVAELEFDVLARRHQEALREHMDATAEVLAELEADARALRGAP